MLTAASFVGMSIYALTTKKDLTIYGSLISGASVCMITISFILIFTSTPWLRMLYSFLGIFAALLFIAVDTQMIIQNRKHGIGIDDYIRASVMLYLDFIQLFLHLLSLLGSRK